MICIEMDANAKLGGAIVTGDQKEQSKKVVTENDLVVVKAQDLCKGVITRYHKTVNCQEESVLDDFIVYRRFYNLVKSMRVDEERVYSLTKYIGRTGSIKNSNHNTLIME